MKRVILLVIDSAGIGALPDAPEFGDLLECNTFANVANKTAAKNTTKKQAETKTTTKKKTVKKEE